MNQTPIHYTVHIPHPHTHTAQIEAVFPTSHHPELTLMMAVWTPGSYMVREYAKHVEHMEAYNPATQQPLPLQKTHKNRWVVTCPNTSSVAIRYTLYGREMTVRTNWISEEHLLLNGAATFITAKNFLHHPHHVQFSTPFAWKNIATALPQHNNVYQAENFDALVDSPFLCGDLYTHTFTQDAVPYTCAYAHATQEWKKPSLHQDMQKLIATQHAFWGAVPYKAYAFLSVLGEGKGGLEHNASCVLMDSPHALRKKDTYIDWLGLVSHELFHAWNIKRLRPVELGPFDYEQENFTHSLWVAEGFTAYYDDLLVHRAGLSNTQEYLERLSRNMEQVHTHPGHRVQNLTDASWDAWIKFYRRDENSHNCTVSYYAKGALVAFLTDIALRTHSNHAFSLDSLMRHAYTLFAGPTGYTHTQWVELIQQHTSKSFHPLLHNALYSTQPLDFTQAFEWLGLAFKTQDPPTQKPFWGLQTRAVSNALMVTEVQRNSPASHAGIQAGDELLAINQMRTTPSSFDDDVAHTQANTPATLLIARKNHILTRTLTPAFPPAQTWKITVLPNPTPSQKTNLETWLQGHAQASA
jgi:predicted metalloprotease with PDZ domain